MTTPADRCALFATGELAAAAASCACTLGTCRGALAKRLLFLQTAAGVARAALRPADRTLSRVDLLDGELMLQAFGDLTEALRDPVTGTAPPVPTRETIFDVLDDAIAARDFTACAKVLDAVLPPAPHIPKNLCLRPKGHPGPCGEAGTARATLRESVCMEAVTTPAAERPLCGPDPRGEGYCACGCGAPDPDRCARADCPHGCADIPVTNLGGRCAVCQQFLDTFHDVVNANCTMHINCATCFRLGLAHRYCRGDCQTIRKVKCGRWDCYCRTDETIPAT